MKSLIPAALQARLRSLSQRERLLLLVCAVSLLLFGGIRWGVYPLIDYHRKSRAAIPQRMGTLARYRLAAQGEGRIDEAFAEAAERLEEMEEGLLPGDNPAAAGSALQGLLKPWVERQDTRLISMRTLPPVSKGAYAEVPIQMELQTTTDGLTALLAEIPRNRKILRVKKLSVTSGFYGASTAANRRENLVVSIVVSGLADVDLDAKGGGARE